MAVRPPLSPGIPQQTPTFFSLSYTPHLHPHIPRIRNASLRTTPFHFVLCFPTDLLLRNFPLNIVLGAFLLPVLCCDLPVLFF